ncbi:sugar kinase [Lacibacterium aquatile]|uniref:Sugar kinase n=1 Tax=Lacibacterium aquatile TaxID=1168082 RepID=A0ABW5DL29_9PROT
MNLEILGLGEAMVEFNAARGEAGQFLQGFGGDTSNTVIAASRQGATTGYLSAVGNDVFGGMLLDLWQAEGVSHKAVEISETAPTGIYFVTHGPNGHEFTYYRAGSAAAALQADKLPRTAIEAAQILHLSGISLAISAEACDAALAAIAIAKKARRLVSFDTNLRLKLWPLDRARAMIHAVAAKADILLPSVDEARTLTGLIQPEEIADFYLGLGCPLVVMKLGKEGALVSDASGKDRIAGLPVQAVDATGAGDTFDGAFLAEYLRTKDARKAARYGNAAAALSTQGYGAVAPIPRREEVEAFLASRG